MDLYAQARRSGNERRKPKPGTGGSGEGEPIGYSPRTVKYMHTTIRKALDMAVEWGTVPRNVARAVRSPRVPRVEITPPNPEEVSRLLDSAEAHGDPLVGLWTTMVYSGCREGELLGLRWSDVDLDAGTLAIRRTLAGAKAGEPVFHEPKTSTARRTVTLAPVALAALRAHHDRQDFEKAALREGYADHGLVFASAVGTPLNASNVCHRFKSALRRAGLSDGFRPHDLRHAAATLMLKAGVHPKVASERLGHATTQITLDLYTHAVQGMEAEAAGRIHEALTAAREKAAREDERDQPNAAETA